jgi:hypothetical protein
MTKAPLGRLEMVELRNYWESESAHFTPWLAQEANMALLSDALGMELEVEHVERDVGSFRADILCKEIGTDHMVLVENQLERTNHSHLGQIITYAAGLNARTIVWIAKKFAEEHREALVWLNEVSGEDLRFFGLEVELWRIGDSSPAPKFNIIAKPNDWAKAVRDGASKDTSASSQSRLAFWTAFCDGARRQRSPLRISTPQGKHYMHFRLGRSGVVLSAVASAYNSNSRSYEVGELRVQLLIQGPHAQAVYRALLHEKTRVEAEFGRELEWNESDEVNRRRISVRMDGDIEDRTRWPEQHAWLLKNLESMQKIFSPLIRALGTGDIVGSEAA